MRCIWRSATAPRGLVATIAVNDAVLVVLNDSFPDRVLGVVSAVAGQGGLALRSAELLAGLPASDVAI